MAPGFVFYLRKQVAVGTADRRQVAVGIVCP